LEPSKKIRVWLASNLMSLRAGFRALLADCLALECVGESELYGDGLESIEKAQPDVLILDINSHDRKTNAMLKRLTGRIPATRIIALSASGDRRFVLRLLRRGVHGYITHGEASVELIKAIEAVAQGDVFLCPSASGVLLTEYRKRARRRTSGSLAAGCQPTSKRVHLKKPKGSGLGT
jgi:DNA-binding NarL/FixJ family response regulator